MRKQYHFRPSGRGYHAWNVDKLIQLTQNKLPEEVNLASIKELDENYWFDSDASLPSCRAIVKHMELILEADMDYPIILCPEGRVMDGMHRVAKALLEGKQGIRAVRMESLPSPDYSDVQPEDLPY